MCGLIYSPSLFWSLGLDQNIFAEIGSLLLQCKKLYVDAWDVKPPNIFYVYAFFEWIFGQHEFAVRVSDYVFSLIACVAIFVATERQSSPIAINGRGWAAPLAAVLLALTLLSLGLADTAQTESYSLAFMLAAVAISFAKMGDKRYRLFVAGALIGIATFFKTTNAIFLIPITVELFFRDRKHFVRSLLLFFLGFIIWCGLQLGILAIEGSLGEYLQITYRVLTHHSNEVSDLGTWSVFRAIWLYVDLWSILVIVAIVVALIRRDSAFLRTVRMPLLLLCAGVAAVIVQNKGWGYQYVVLLPGLIPICAIAGIYLYDRIKERSRWTAVICAIFILIHTLALSPSARRRIHNISDAMLSIRDHPVYVGTLGSIQSLYYPLGTDTLGRYLRDHTTPKDEVFIFGEEPGAYWRAERIPATRFVYSLLFTSGVISDGDLQAMKDSLSQKKPAVIVIERFDTTAFRGRPETSESLVVTDSRFKTLHDLLGVDYKIGDTVCDKFMIYHRVN